MQKTLIALACASASLAASADPVILKVAHFWPATALSQQKVLEPWCAKIAQESNNTLQCQIYPSMQLGGTPPQLFDQAKDGVVDLTVVAGHGAAGEAAAAVLVVQDDALAG